MVELLDVQLLFDVQLQLREHHELQLFQLRMSEWPQAIP